MDCVHFSATVLGAALFYTLPNVTSVPRGPSVLSSLFVYVTAVVFGVLESSVSEVCRCLPLRLLINWFFMTLTPVAVKSASDSGRNDVHCCAIIIITVCVLWHFLAVHYGCSVIFSSSKMSDVAVVLRLITWLSM